jgi:hypothetical protein
MREFTPAQADDLYELLTERAGRPGRSLILTSNRSPSDWYPLLPNPVVGESILDRSSTPVTTCSWKARATGRGGGPAAPGPQPGARHGMSGAATRCRSRGGDAEVEQGAGLAALTARLPWFGHGRRCCAAGVSLARLLMSRGGWTCVACRSAAQSRIGAIGHPAGGRARIRLVGRQRRGGRCGRGWTSPVPSCGR